MTRMGITAVTMGLTCAGCGPQLDADPAWALDWASVTPTAQGLEGYHVWEFFVDGWQKKHDEDYYKCSLWQEVTATEVDPPQGCSGCEAAYELTFSIMESDCPREWSSDQDWYGTVLTGIGVVPDDLYEDAPYGGFALGWYLGFEGEEYDGGREVLPHGYAYAEVLEQDGAPSGHGWIEGETYILWPAYVWELE